MLQEETCFNAKTRETEPLGLQKMMMRHLSQISNYKVHVVNENEARHDHVKCVNKVLRELNPDLKSELEQAQKEIISEML